MSAIVLGIDGGGTKTAVCAWDRARDRVARAEGGRSAVIGLPSAAALATLRSAADAALGAIGATRADVVACAVGLSGIDFADEHPGQLRVLGDALAMPVVLVNDAIVALWGAAPSPAAVILQHGTAITSAWRGQFGEERCFDHLDAGRQNDVRTECLVRVARMIDGRAARTPLAERVLAHLGIADPATFHELVYRSRLGPAAATLASVVFAAWEADDPAATELVEAALDDYVCASVAMIRRTASPTPYVAFGGGVLDRAPPRLRERLEATVRAAAPGATVGSPLLGPDRGAALMAAHVTGADPAASFARIGEATVHAVDAEVSR